mmetsp:Transcript_47991/g.118802  ORF Transcript_47991/g.118802 Transcript_47991/m.118802 type:complete len:134 (-) Transcript_47991:138-539(-)
MAKFQLNKTPVHLGLGAKSIVLPEFDGTMEWYQKYGDEHANDGAEGRLVSVHTFTEDWKSWEVHPNGSELVYVMSGKMILVQKTDGLAPVEICLEGGEAAINPPGVWHTAKVDGECTALFITAGEGTQHGQPP